MKRIAASVSIAFLGVVSFAACSDPIEAIDVLTDCENVCDKYQDCFDPDYDVSECRNRCQENGDDEAFADDVSLCEDCIDDKTCEEGAFDCDSLCENVVP